MMVRRCHCSPTPTTDSVALARNSGGREVKAAGAEQASETMPKQCKESIIPTIHSHHTKLEPTGHRQSDDGLSICCRHGFRV